MKLNQDLVRQISKKKQEPGWMLKKRLQAFAIFEKLPLPKFGPDLSKIDLSKIDYFKPAGFRKAKSWEKVPAKKLKQLKKDLLESIKDTAKLLSKKIGSYENS